jgi:hypothetical protein
MPQRPDHRIERSPDSPARGGLRDELTAVRASGTVSLDPDAYVFPTTSGKQFGIESFRNRVLAGSVRDANNALTRAGEAPLP